jgi:FKBP-type peptidyl-prolyl cis-trans isomerase FklB
MNTLKSTLVVLALVVVLGACNKVPNTGKMEFKSKVDSVSYALGYLNANQAKNQFKQTPYELDSVDFVKMAKVLADAKLHSQLMERLESQFDTINEEAFSKGFLNEFAYGKSYFDEMSADMFLRKVYGEIQERKQAANKVIGEENLAKGQKFLEENKNKPGIVVLESGLQYEVLKEGTGEKPSATDRVECHYHGTLLDGTVFDSSVERGETSTFGVSQVIKGWTEALQLMPVGSKWKLYIPAELAYGERGSQPKIGPNEALIFEVEVISIK